MQAKLFIGSVVVVLIGIVYYSFSHQDFRLFCRLMMSRTFQIQSCQQGMQAKFFPDKFQRITISSGSSGRDLVVEVANTNATITKGLGERDVLGSDGMLFVMPSRDIPTFWMKGMRFDLDFVWIDGNTVVDLTQNVPAEPGVTDYQLKTYSPKAFVTRVLEMNAGEVAKHHIQIGDTVTY